MAKKELSFNEKLLAMSEKYKTNLDVQYLDSGSVIVNMVLGGGLPMGKNIEIYSNSGYGKSTITLSICFCVSLLSLAKTFVHNRAEKAQLIKLSNNFLFFIRIILSFVF